MTYTFASRLGEQLYQLLPEIYRTRDKQARPGTTGSGTDDLARYLDAHGHLLDLIHATLQQQLKDALPTSGQEWLLPYFAQLLAATMVSPDIAGRHAEIDNAVSWRQRKGTLKCVEAIAETVGQMEVEIQEGWKRVALTPRIGAPLMPSWALDATLNLDMAIPSEAVRHPDLPAVTVDFRRPSRAVVASADNPAARTSTFGGVKQIWRQANRHGAACFPGSYDDVSRRTVDLRTPNATQGHHHHHRLLAYAPPASGLFPLEPESIEWSRRNETRYAHLIEEKEENGVWVIRNRTDRVIEFTGDATLDDPRPYRVEGLIFHNLTAASGSELTLDRVEANRVTVDTFSVDTPVVTARDCLFNELAAGAGLARLDSCTILTRATLRAVDAVDCIFNDFAHDPDAPMDGTVRHSRIPGSLYDQFHDPRRLVSCTTAAVAMFAASIAYSAGRKVNNGAGVLRPECGRSVYAGASDGGEMGYFHKGRAARPVRIDGGYTGANGLAVPATGGYALRDVIFKKPVESQGGPLTLIRCAVPAVTAKQPLFFDPAGAVAPSLKATDCIIGRLTAATGLVRLEYCTVMETTDCRHLQASDCIFVGAIDKVTLPATNKTRASFSNCLRFSSLPAGFLAGIEAKPDSDGDKKLARALGLIDTHGRLRLATNTLERPIFDRFSFCVGPDNARQVEHRAAAYGEWGYGVLSQLTPPAVSFGAEDGGEMGAYHHKHYRLKAESVRHKMKEFLPVGIEPVLIDDTRLIREPPKPLTQHATDNGESP